MLARFSRIRTYLTVYRIKGKDILQERIKGNDLLEEKIKDEGVLEERKNQMFKCNEGKKEKDGR